jgi:hypothetical protein
MLNVVGKEGGIQPHACGRGCGPFQKTSSRNQC